ncbi:MAG: hypothetical protein ACE5RI_09195 [Candidatus Nitrosomaritimum yanchengensis]
MECSIIKNNKIFEIRTYLKTYIATTVAVLTFSQFVYQLFGQTIPNLVWGFFKEFGTGVVLVAVFLFVIAWILKARPHSRPKSYSLITFDVFGAESTIDGIRTEFKTHDVAWSFMKEYKKAYPLYNFALVSDFAKSNKRTIFRYI